MKGICTEIETLHTITQEMAETLDNLKHYLEWQAKNKDIHHGVASSLAEQTKQTLTKWTEFAK